MAVVWLLAIIGTLAIGFAYIIQPKVSRDPFEFLGERRPFLTGAFRGIGCFNSGINEYRAYSWRGDYASTVTAASKELSDQGFKETYNKNGIVNWNNYDGAEVTIQQGYSWSREQATGARGREPGVTVIFSNDLPEDLPSKLRTWIEPS